MSDEDTGVAPIRNAVRALIVVDEAVLIQQKIYEDGSERYCLPGGSPHPGETLLQALQRECAEEIGCVIDVLDLLHVADFYKPGRDDPTRRRQQVEFIFACRVPRHYVPCNGPQPDKHQTDVRWLPFAQLPDRAIFPPGLETLITRTRAHAPVYLGLLER
jgi:8-oxo-dGTP diphosphatase